ncbi:hypothetical protein TcasGA2_TC012102 [Tribolium castaneum]|uniref:Mediator of RNA polymerase II transcription subunit 9 n=1 Tax=Tribolium castaneum TaxID=7070 RepID=D6X1Y0_TRICA|nr:hypothetical protein TcasGA2_TC012102 [Tribolium castaneum]
MMESDEHNQESERNVTVENLNIEILPIIYEIIRSVEKDHHDNTAKARESQDCSQKVLELQKRLDQARAEIRLLPGIEYSKEQQLDHLEALKTQLKLKQELLRKYRYILSESYPMRKAAQVVVRAVYHGKNLIEERGLDKRLSPEEFRALMKRIAQNLQGQIKQASDEFKHKMK